MFLRSHTPTTEQESETPNNHGKNVEHSMNRRSILGSVLLTLFPIPAAAAQTSLSRQPPLSSDSRLPIVTHRVCFDVRITSREYRPSNNHKGIPITSFFTSELSTRQSVFATRLTLDLYGEAFPNHVTQFLNYVVDDGKYDGSDAAAATAPSYGHSTFVRLDPENGLLSGGCIDGLVSSSLGGSAALSFHDRAYPAPLWTETNVSSPSSERGILSAGTAQLRSEESLGMGYLVHRVNDTSPVFGITTRPITDRFVGLALANEYQVFGRVVPNVNRNDFFEKLQRVPTYSSAASVLQPNEGLGPAGSKLLQNIQSLSGVVGKGEELFEGKLLRRVEVFRVQMDSV